MTTGPIAKLVIQGNFDGIQSWSCGLTCQAETAPTDAQLATWLGSVEALVSTWWGVTNGAGSQNKSTCTIPSLKAYGYSELGVTASGVAQYNYTTPLAGADTTHFNPTQCAMVCTLETAFPGKHNTGRIYVPKTGGTLLATNRISATITAAMATSTAALCTALAGLTINGTTTSAVLVPSSGASESHFVSAVSVGDVVDTQRRRRDQYVEVRAVHAV